MGGQYNLGIMVKPFEVAWVCLGGIVREELLFAL